MTRVSEHFRSLWIWATVLPVFAGACLAIWLASFFLRGAALENLIKAFCRLVLLLCGIRLRVHGRGRVIPGRQFIIMMNHVNFFDPLVIYAAFPGWARGIEEESHFRWPVYGATIQRLGVVPVDRKNTAKALASLKKAAELIRRRREFSFVVLPEGTRTLDERLGPFKRGGFHLALETGLEILPIVQVGAGRINRKGSRLVRPGRLDLFIESAVPTAGYARETIGDLSDRVRAVFLRRVD